MLSTETFGNIFSRELLEDGERCLVFSDVIFFMYNHCVLLCVAENQCRRSLPGTFR